MITTSPGAARSQRNYGRAIRDKHGELMGDNIIGIYLSERPFHSSFPSEAVVDEAETIDELHDATAAELGRFVDHQDKFQNPLLLGAGLHGVVVLADIKGVKYALKVFKKWKQPGPVFYRYEDAVRMTPLANECRAFARLNSHNENGTWAARCYGWMKLSDTQFEVISRVVDSHGLSRWAVVKEYLPMPTEGCHFDEMRDKLKIPGRLRIYPQDLRLENCRGAKVVDLSSTLTAPCAEWSEFEFNFFFSEIAPWMFTNVQL
ncbi:hypothetical protein ABEF92_002397 [Exophiala dermatitidis]|uniref:Protein kinase domain-containing protein n=1 Tax=Exophiala dermatitidis (strain ATCC 34100 / CBS 525.76 / NIH/UT8656) TaxID=858893 RepID=H6BKY3_EXODN|nr:uncharacterized protein HMPREF1120_00011 [Exophiala dermatitidis NIH/UT8656]EHY51784.1 hypothetical protein HMPREF1120_00011 [Exophiala dermatitidis NIH/UT8656]